MQTQVLEVYQIPQPIHSLELPQLLTASVQPLAHLAQAWDPMEADMEVVMEAMADTGVAMEEDTEAAMGAMVWEVCMEWVEWEGCMAWVGMELWAKTKKGFFSTL